MSVEASSWVWKHSPYRDATLIVHLAIADVVNDTHHNECWMTRDALAVKAHTSASTVGRAVKQMLDDGLLTLVARGGGRGHPSHYRFEMPESTGLWTNGETLSDCARFVDEKHGHLTPESVSSDRRVMTTQSTQEHKDDQSNSVVDNAADPDCTSCRGSGVIYNATAGADASCHCVADPDYEAAPLTATRPVVGFGMPASRGPAGGQADTIKETGA